MGLVHLLLIAVGVIEGVSVGDFDLTGAVPVGCLRTGAFVGRLDG